MWLTAQAAITESFSCYRIGRVRCRAMAWEKEAEALERHAEVMTALQKEMIRALLRVAEEYDADPVQLAMNASNSMHGLFAPLHQLHAERMQGQHM